MPKDSSARYYKKTKKKFRKRVVKDITVLLKKKNTKSKNMVANDISIS